MILAIRKFLRAFTFKIFCIKYAESRAQFICVHGTFVLYLISLVYALCVIGHTVADENIESGIKTLFVLFMCWLLRGATRSTLFFVAGYCIMVRSLAAIEEAVGMMPPKDSGDNDDWL